MDDDNDDDIRYVGINGVFIPMAPGGLDFPLTPEQLDRQCDADAWPNNRD